MTLRFVSPSAVVLLQCHGGNYRKLLNECQDSTIATTKRQSMEISTAIAAAITAGGGAIQLLAPSTKYSQ